ncbi:hypothetical protein BLNAU_5026 [Blattamonas nauphoetae]|uniref:Uncharacterized protein n=1 Tax=Blattamonas nauphoetae TaxID=2049346 RepID=A0ABQ9Y8X7_9EUKA|nr:hypothetical protein BLNAU_5026 [Blattamonas nauphoetae]
MVCSFGFVVHNAAVCDCHIVDRPLSKQFLAWEQVRGYDIKTRPIHKMTRLDLCESDKIKIKIDADAVLSCCNSTAQPFIDRNRNTLIGALFSSTLQNERSSQL